MSALLEAEETFIVGSCETSAVTTAGERITGVALDQLFQLLHEGRANNEQARPPTVRRGEESSEEC